MTQYFRYVIVLWMLVSAQIGWAQEEPKVVRIILPFAAGNPVDTSARDLAVALSKVTGRQFIIENKPGAGATLATGEVAKAKPDGSVILYTSGGHTTTAVLFKRLPYDPIKDFTPITQISVSPGFLLMVSVNSPFKTVADLLDHAKRNPGGVSYASAGIGNTTHLVGALFEQAAKVKLLHVPYKANYIPDLLGGHVDSTFLGTSIAQPLVREGKLRALAITGDVRSPLMPDVPTFKELGIAGIDVPAWAGLLAPANMPKQMAERLRESVKAAIHTPEYLARMAQSGSSPLASSPDEFKAYIESEIARYREKLGPLNIQMD